MAKRISACNWLLAGLLAGTAGCGLQTPPVDLAQTEPVPQQPTAPFPVDTLYSLLVAETAAHRGQLDIALANYYQQSYKTRDAGVVRRGTLLAQHLNASQAALDLAQLWATIEPTNPEPVYLAGQYFIAFERLDLATTQSRRLLELDAESLFVAIASSPATRDPATHAALLEEYRLLLQQYPDNIDLLLGHAWLLAQQGDFTSSLSSIEQAQRIDSDNLQAQLLEVDVLYKDGRPDKAIRRMADIVRDDPENERLRLQYARLLAEEDLGKAREQFDYLALKNSMDPDLLLARALLNYQLKDNVQAQDQFEQLLFLKKHTSTAHYYLGEILLAQDQDAKALEHYRRVENGSEYLPSTRRAFDIMIEQDRRLEGQKWLAEQRKLQPDLAVRLYLVEAEALLQRSDQARSLAALDEAITHHPERIELYYARSLVLERSGKSAAAESDLRFVLARQPDHADALNALGYLLADSNRNLEEAYALIHRALALRPTDPSIIDSMGWVLFRLGRLEESLLRLKDAFQRFPNDEIAAHLGEVLWTLGKPDEADKIWQQGLKLNPDSALISSTRQRLQRP